MVKANVGRGERWVRMCAGLLCMVRGLVFLRGTLPGYLVSIVGCITFLIGLVRWCLFRAMSGRALQE